MCCRHFLQTCSRLNSSENTSISVPQFWHLQRNDLRFLNASKPGQWLLGVFIVFAFCVEVGSCLLGKSEQGTIVAVIGSITSLYELPVQ